MNDARCENCGCGIAAGALICGACGLAPSLGAPVGAVSDRTYALAPLTPATYDVTLGVGPVLSWTISNWAKNMPRLALVGALPFALLLLLVVAGYAAYFITGLGFGTFGGHMPITSSWQFGVAYASIGTFLGVFATLTSAAVTIHITDERARGFTVGVRTAFAFAAHRIGWLALALPVFVVLGAVAVAGIAAPIAFGVAKSEPLLALLAVPGLLVSGAAVVVFVRLLPALAVIVVEDLSTGNAFARAFEITRGKTGALVGVVAVAALAWFGAWLLTAAFGIVPLIGMLAQLAADAVLLPVMFVFVCALYAACVSDRSRSSPPGP